MPRDLARDPSATVFEYGAIISPPRDWDRWAELVERLAGHLVERYGADEVARVGLRGLERAQPRGLLGRHAGGVLPALRGRRPRHQVGRRAAAGRRAVHRRRRLDPRVRSTSSRPPGVPLDFVTTHAYGIPPLDFRPGAARRAGSTASRSGGPSGASRPPTTPRSNDRPYGAPFVLRGMKSGQRAADAVSLLGGERPLRGDGARADAVPRRLRSADRGQPAQASLLGPRAWPPSSGPTVSGSRSPATAPARSSRPSPLAATTASSTFSCGMSRSTSPRRGDPICSTGPCALRIDGLAGSGHEATLARVDADHSDISARWQPSDGAAWPAPEWARAPGRRPPVEEDIGAFETDEVGSRR